MAPQTALDTRHPRLLLPLIPIVLLTALLARTVSLQWSPLPYNIDGLSELRVVQDILASGHLDFPPMTSIDESYVSDMPLLGLLTAFLSSALGADPVSFTQLSSSIIGSVAVLTFLLVFLHHFPNSRRAVLASALVLALTGSFVFSTGCTWKEVLAFLMIALALYSYPLRSNMQHRALLTITLILLVFTHHHSAVVAYVIFTFAIVIDIASKTETLSLNLTRNHYLDILTALSAWILAALYYSRISLPYLDYLSPSTDLYLYIAVAFLMLLVAVRLSRRNTPISRLPLELSVPVIGALVMLVNYYRPLFPGLPAPSAAIAVPFLAYLLLVVPAWGGVRALLVPKGPTKNLLLAMLLGPLSLILFAFLRANDATSHLIIYRTFDFALPAFALLIGAGFALIVKGRERLGAVAGVSLVVICASTLPVAYSSQELFGVENQTYWFEYDAVKWFSEHGVEGYASDQRLSETGTRLFDLENSRGLPYDLREGIALTGGSMFVLETDWSSSGAQEFPFGVVVVEKDTVSSTLEGASVFYIGGPMDGQLVGFRTR
jgi:hypothetical protein